MNHYNLFYSQHTKDIFPKVFIHFLRSALNEIWSFLFPLLLIKFLMSILIAAMLCQWTSKASSQNCPIFWLQNHSLASNCLLETFPKFQPYLVHPKFSSCLQSRLNSLHKPFYPLPVGWQGWEDVRLSSPILFAAIPMHLKAAMGRRLFLTRIRDLSSSALTPEAQWSTQQNHALLSVLQLLAFLENYNSGQWEDSLHFTWSSSSNKKTEAAFSARANAFGMVVNTSSALSLVHFSTWGGFSMSRVAQLA